MQISGKGINTYYCKWLLFSAIFFLFGVTSANNAFAQETGVRITPAVIEETLDPGVSKEYSVKVTNLNNNSQTFYVFTRNIKGVKDGGTPVFAENDLERTGYELADWVDLSVSEIYLPGSTATSVNFTINIPEDGSPGSHFGGVFLSVEPPDLDNSGAAVGYQVANIISIRVSGDVVEEADIRQFSTSKFIYGSQNVEFSVRIENKGNVLVRPYGPLEVYNMLGNKVDTIIFNEEQAAVFPNDMRDFHNIVWQGNSVGFGRYEAKLSPIYGDEGAKKTMSSTVTFWILPMSIIGPALGVLAFILLVTFISVRLYIRRSLAHITPGRRIVRRRRRQSGSPVLLFVVVMMTVTALFLIVLLALFA